MFNQLKYGKIYILIEWIYRFDACKRWTVMKYILWLINYQFLFFLFCSYTVDCGNIFVVICILCTHVVVWHLLHNFCNMHSWCHAIVPWWNKEYAFRKRGRSFNFWYYLYSSVVFFGVWSQPLLCLYRNMSRKPIIIMKIGKIICVFCFSQVPNPWQVLLWTVSYN